MLRDALNFLTELAENAATTFSVSNTAGKREVFDSKTGLIKWVDTPFLKCGTVDSVADLVEVCAQFGCEQSAVWVSKSQVVLVLNSDNPHEKFTMKLNQHPAIEILKQCRGSHKAVMQMLRHGLAAVSVSPYDFITVLSSLKMETSSETGSTVRPGDESLAKSTRAKVTGETQIPEFVEFNFNVFPELDISTHGTLRCSVVIDPVAQTVSIIPIPGAIEMLIVEAQKTVASAITETLEGHPDIPAEVQVYCGTYCGN